MGVIFCIFQELATEIILTLGEAFEIAYQIALRKEPEDDDDRHRSDSLDSPTQDRIESMA